MTATKNQAKKSITVGRKCSVCSHERVKEINSAINEGKSFRAISCQIQDNDSMRESVRRHTENCLKLEISALVQKAKTMQAIDFQSELAESLHLIKKQVRAVEKWLSDPDDPNEFDISPRGDEITVVYLDHNDLFMNEPKRKKAKLADLLAACQGKGFTAIAIQSSAMDMRKLLLETSKAHGDRLEQIAKFYGYWAKDNAQKNPSKLSSDDDLARSLYAYLVERFINDNIERREKEMILEKIVARVEMQFPQANVKLLTAGI